MRTSKRWLAIILLACLLPGAALASPFPAWERFGWMAAGGEPYSLGITAEVHAWPDLAEESLGALQTWLAAQRLELTVKAPGDSREALARWMEDGQEAFTLYTLEGAGEPAVTLAIPDSLPATRYLGSAAQPPWEALIGSTPRLAEPLTAAKALADIGQAGLSHLLPEEKAVKSAISVKNAGRGASQLVYSLDKAKAQAFWEAAAPELLPLMDQLFLALLPGQAPAFSEALKTLEMKGTLGVKRILNQEGQDLGLQITGTFAINGQTRRLTLFGGQSDSGVYWSFKLPATRGNDTLEAQLSLKTEPGSLQGDWRLKAVSGKQRLEVSGKVSLKTTAEEAGERLGGSLSVKIRRDGLTEDYSLQPDLLLSGEALTGSLRLTLTRGRLVRQDVTLHLSGAPADSLEAPLALAEVDLNGQRTALLAARTGHAMAAVWKRLLLSLPEPAKSLLLHDLGRDRRANHDFLLTPVPETFTVTDETGPSTTKEETP